MNWPHLKQLLKSKATLKRNSAQTAPFVERSLFDTPALGHWYAPVLLGPGTIGARATSSACLQQAVQIIERLEADDYVRYLLAYYQTGMERFGETWHYADIVTVLLAAAQLVQPQYYLEIGVRRGRSIAMVAATCPECEIIGFDLWLPDYAGMPNPGPNFVRTELTKVGYTGHLDLISGNSHETVPEYLSQYPDLFFDMITVDGDHSTSGARQDLYDTLPRLKIGGVIVFDDICHPSHPNLTKLWRQLVATSPRYATWEFTELGYGVALAVRKY